MTSDNLIGKWFIKNYTNKNVIIGKIIKACPEKSSPVHPFYKCEIYKDTVYCDLNKYADLIIYGNEDYIELYNSYAELIADVI